MFGPDLAVVAAYVLGVANAVREVEVGVKVAIDRPCAVAAESMRIAADWPGRATTARDQHRWHTERIERQLMSKPAERRD